MIITGPFEAYLLQSPDYVGLFVCIMISITCALAALSRQRTRIEVQVITPGSRLLVRLRKMKTIPWSEIDRIRIIKTEGGWKARLYPRRGFFGIPYEIQSDMFERPDATVSLIKTHMTDKSIPESGTATAVQRPK